MAKSTRSRHRGRARKPASNTAPSQRHTDASSALAERDLLAAIFDAAGEDSDLEKYLSRVVAHLGQYSKCCSIGVFLLEEDGVTTCTASHGGATEFRRTPKDCFPESETFICNAIVRVGSDPRLSYLKEGGAFLRNSKTDASARTETAVGAFGTCIGSTFESIALIPVTYPKKVVGFIFIGDEHKDRISPVMAKFLERIGTYVGSTILSLESLNKLRQSGYGSRVPSGKTATASPDSDEMELVTRLIDNSNESIVISQDWRIIYVNNKCAEMAGLSKQDMIGLAFLDITHQDDRPAVIERYSRILNGEWLPNGITVRGLDKEGNTRWAELREIPFKWNGRPAIMSLVNDITDRKRAEEALALSERKYRQLVETVSEGIWVIDKDANTVFVNPRMAEMMGYTVEEMTGKHLLSLVTDKRGVEVADRKLESRQQGIRERYEAEAIRKDGTKIYLSVCASPILDDDGRYNGSIAGVQDVTDRVQAEQALRDSERYYRFLADNTTDVIWTADLNLKPTYFSPSIANLMGYTVEEAMEGTLETRLTPASAKAAAKLFEEAMTGEKQKPGTAIGRTVELELVRKDGSTVWVETTVTFMRDSEGRAIGVLGAMRDVTGRKRIEEALRQSETKYKNLFEHTLLGMEVIDGETGRTVLANHSLSRMFGFKSPADMIGTNPMDYVLPEDRDWVVGQIAQLMADPTWDKTAQIRSRTEDGRIIWLTGMGTPIDYEGRPAMLLSLVDITVAREAESKLQESEERYRLVVDNANEGIAVVQDGLLKFANRRFADATGYSVEELCSKPFSELIHPDDRQLVIDYYLRRLDGQEVPPLYQCRFIDKAGKTNWTEVNAVLFNWEGRTATLALMGDITDRKRADDALKASEEKFRALAENSSDLIVLLNRDGVISYESPAAGQLLGLSPEERIGEGPFERLHPDDLARATETFGELMRNPSAGPRRIDELRLQHRDGSWRIMEATGSAIVRGGEVDGIVVTLHDITDRKKAEDALKASEERFRTIIENAQDAVTIVDENFNVVYESPSLGTVTGYSPEEWLGKSLGEMQVHPDDMPLLASEFERLKSQPGLVIEDTCVRYKHRDGSWHIIQATARNLLHDPGVKGIVVNFRDVTARKQAEEALRESEEKFRNLAEQSPNMIFINANGRIVYANRLCERITGYTQGELQSPDFDFRVLTAPEYRHLVEEKFRLHMSGEELTPYEYSVITKDGRRLDTILSTKLISYGGEKSILGTITDITGRKRAEQAMRESERRYRLLAENITDVIWTTDMQTNITYMSPSATPLVGFSAEELSTMTVEDLLTPDSFERGMKALTEQQTKVTQRQDGQPDHWTLEVELRRKDGSTVWVEEKVTFIRDEEGMPIGLLGATRDISLRKRAEEALRLSEEKYRTLVEASPDGILSIDAIGRIVDSNAGVSTLLRRDKADIIGQDARSIVTMKVAADEPRYGAQISEGGMLEAEIELVRPDGQTVPVWAKAVRLAEQKTGDIATVVYLRDIADRRKIDEMKDEFVGLVSHELRSPLTVIIGALHTAISEGPRLSQRETRQLLEDAALEAEQLSHLVGNLLELSRAQANRLFLHVEPVNLAKAVHKVIESIERQSPKHKFIVDLPRKLPPVSADQLRLERILYNLLENGVKYSPEGSEITVSAKRDAGHLVVSVSDQGAGISKEDQPKLFKPFQQLGDPILDHTKGAGLGLLVCRRLVEAHGGRIWVESQPNHGATFFFTLEASSKSGLDAG